MAATDNQPVNIERQRFFYVKRWTVFLDWAEVCDVGINAFDDQNNLFAFDLTAEQARKMAAQLNECADAADKLDREYSELQQEG